MVENWYFWGLSFLRLNHRAALVIPAFWANRVSRHSTAALWAVRDLLFLDAIVATAFAGSAVGVFAFWDGHRRSFRRSRLNWELGDL